MAACELSGGRESGVVRIVTKIEECEGLSREAFTREVLPNGKPLVIRGLVRDWPIVKAAEAGRQQVCDYLMHYDRGYPLNTAFAPASAKGRLFYNSDFSGMNFRLEESKLQSALEYLNKHADDEPAPMLAIQSIPTSQYLPGFAQDNPMSLLDSDIDPRIWIGNRATVAAHFDPSENIACCAVGRRRFTLFPPEQVKNLYPGPFEKTPSGAVVSLVDFEEPDHLKFPKFKIALEAAQHAELEPGDAIFIPYLWWHHVQSLSSLNVLVNYWWGGFDPKHGDPNIAMYHAMIAIKSMPESRRQHWKQLFGHYVFDESVEAATYLPPERRGILGKLDAKLLQSLKAAVARSLSRS
jgi:hypothetical protein